MLSFLINGVLAPTQALNGSLKKPLNDMRMGSLSVAGISSSLRSSYAVGNSVKAYLGNTLWFQGQIIDKQTLTGGIVMIKFAGQEIDFVDAPGLADSGQQTKTWISQTDNTIFAEIVAAVSGWTADVTHSTPAVQTSFSGTTAEKPWGTLMRLLKQTGKDIYIDDATKTIYLYDELQQVSGNSSYRFTETINCSEVIEKELRAEASKVEVFGKGDGKYQIRGSSGSGTPVKTIIDKNIVTVAEANTRAIRELAKISAARKHYYFSPLSIGPVIEPGDEVFLTAGTVGLDNVAVDIVAVERGLNAGKEYLSLEVTNPTYRRAEDRLDRYITTLEARRAQEQSTQQGSGNTLVYSEAYNGNNSKAMTIFFSLPEEFVEDQAGNMRVASMTLDYDVDPFKRGYGSVSQSSVAPDVTGTSDDNTEVEVVDSDENEESIVALAGGGWNQIMAFTPSEHGDGIVFYVHLFVASNDTEPTDTLSYSVRIRADGATSQYIPSSVGTRIARGTTIADKLEHKHEPDNGDYFRTSNGTCTSGFDCVGFTEFEESGQGLTYITPQGGLSLINPGDPYNTEFIIELTHDGAGDSIIFCYVSYDVQSKHQHTEGDYQADSHNHSVSIGDATSDAASVNATYVTVYLDYFDSGSWVNKFSIASTGAILGTDVDITDGGTYPDAPGLWRVRLLTNNASYDYIQGIVKVKHNLDNV